MKKSFCITLVLLASIGAYAQVVKNTSAEEFLSCKINFEPTVSILDIEHFTRQFLTNCATDFEVDKAIQPELLDQNLMRYNPNYYAFEFRPSIQDIFDAPTFQLGPYDNFEQQFRFSNPAFYEANKNTVLSSGYQDFICPTGGINF